MGLDRMADFDLARLINPITPAEFKRDYWERKPLIVRRGQPSYFDGLLSLLDVDQILSSSTIRSGDIRVVRSGKAVSIDDLTARTSSGKEGALETLFSAYRQGATLVLQFLHERWRPLGCLCQSLATEFSASFQANVYLTPPDEQGLTPHYDTHCVFVIQVSGSKHWRIYDGEQARLPLRDQNYTRANEPGKVVEEFDLQLGDSLYIPRGCIHEAVAASSSSLHVTVGAHPILWSSMLLTVLRSVIEKEPRFRESLPIGFASDAELRRTAELQLTELLQTLFDKVDPASIISDAVEVALLSKPPNLDGHLLDLDILPKLKLGSRVRLRPNIISRLTSDEEYTSLHFHGKVVQIPKHVEPDLRYILASSGEFSVGNLPGELDEEGKLVLVRKLTCEGLLAISQA